MTNQFEPIPVLEIDEGADIPQTASEVLEAVADSGAMVAAKSSFNDWASGKFALEGGKCQATSSSVLLPGFTLRTNVAIVNAGIGQEYDGADGMCAWVKDLEQFDFKTFTPAFYDLGGGRILQTFTWTPTLKSGAVSDHNVTDASVVHWQHGKMKSFQYFFGEPDTVEKLYIGNALLERVPKPPTGNQKAWLSLRSTWAEGGFHKANCTKNVNDFVAPSFQMHNIPPLPETGIAGSYHGVDGYCSWIKDLEKFDWSTMKPTDFVIDETHFLMINKVTPTVLGGAKGSHHVEDAALITMKDGKCSAFKYFYSQPKVWSGLFDPVIKKQ